MPDEITVFLRDGSARRLPSDATGESLDASAVAVEVDGRPADLGAPLPDGARVAPIPAASPQGRHIIRHSTAHVLAQAVTDMWPGARYAIGPPVEDGFYYDFELPGGEHFSEADLTRIEERMREIVGEGQPFAREEHTVAEGLEMFSDQPYKLEIISAAAEGAEGAEGAEATEAAEAGEGGEAEGAGPAVVSAYRNTERFVDLCRGPHVASTDLLGHFKLTKVAAAYWRGDERRPQLQRIYGTAWESAEALAEHLHRLEEAEKRDHRRLGAELDLFHFPPEIGGGLPVFHPRGGLVRKVMEDFSRSEHERAGYQFVWTPHLAKSTLYETSGHLGWYAESMYPPMEMEGASYFPKPMNCPMHILVYKSRQRSYRELPLRLFELGTVYRFERSGVLNGLLRVRSITQDDAHIFCAPEQLAPELSALLSFVLRVLRAFGLSDFEAELATRPEKFVGDPGEWDQATDALRSALDDAAIPYALAEGEGSFYAPKIDVHVRDAIGRRWQVSTLQVDFQLPNRFDMEFVGSDNARHRPFMIHRALFGSVERFFGILLEHYAGALPTWLSPVQARVLPVRDDHRDYARSVVDRLASLGARADLAEADEPLGARVRKARLERIPYVLVVGGDDVAAGTLGVNTRGQDRPARGVALEDFEAALRAEIAAPAGS